MIYIFNNLLYDFFFTFHNIYEKLSLNWDEMARTHDQLSSMFSAKQKIVYNQIVDSVESGYEFFLFFLYRYGHTTHSSFGILL
jgi:hypothetical protein